MAKFDFVRISNKPIMICYFWESLKLSIKIEIEQQDQEAVSFEKII